jgi:hypothetical protein
MFPARTSSLECSSWCRALPSMCSSDSASRSIRWRTNCPANATRTRTANRGDFTHRQIRGGRLQASRSFGGEARPYLRGHRAPAPRHPGRRKWSSRGPVRLVAGGPHNINAELRRGAGLAHRLFRKNRRMTISVVVSRWYCGVGFLENRRVRRFSRFCRRGARTGKRLKPLEGHGAVRVHPAEALVITHIFSRAIVIVESS